MVIRSMLVFLLLLVSAVPAALAEEASPKLAGVGVVMMTSPYHGAGSAVMPVPSFAWDYKGFYIRGIEAGYAFYDQGGLKLSAITSPRMMGYSSEDSPALAGMEDRERSLDAGLRAELELPFGKDLSVNAKFLNDTMSRYDGREGELSLEQFVKGKFFRLRLSGGVKAQSSELTGYYYGVRGAEEGFDRPAYSPGMAINPFVGIMLSSGFSKEWPVILRVGVDFLDPVIRRSPIVEDSYTATAMLGFARRF
ncbi:MAG: MipA/OmpV family protein [Candidatus Omnitrophica bacterium]|nr:MipA/OmpV family protein [Candidatus Omnitrophota bacterium]